MGFHAAPAALLVVLPIGFGVGGRASATARGVRVARSVCALGGGGFVHSRCDARLLRRGRGVGIAGTRVDAIGELIQILIGVGRVTTAVARRLLLDAGGALITAARDACGVGLRVVASATAELHFQWVVQTAID